MKTLRMALAALLAPAFLYLPVCAPARAADEARPWAAGLPDVPRVEFTRRTLPNGLTVYLSPDATAPVVSVVLVYNVGSFVEPVGRTGFAHLFEHMMFQGSENVGKAEHTALIVEAGGTMNGGTAPDFTIYYETVPANQLELPLFLEADRMRSLDVSQKNLDNQREVVKEERRMRNENQPYGTLNERLLDLAYTTSPYKHPPIGSMADLDAADLAYVREFFRTFYAPNNATLAIVGDFDPDKAMALVTKYFADIPRGPKPTLPSLEEPPQTEERRETYTDPLARLPRYIAAYHIPNGNDPDAPALQMLASILADGKSSRLWRSLVEQQRVAASVGANGDAGRGPNLFSIYMALGPGQSVEKAEAAMVAEVERLKRDGVTDDEMRKALVGMTRAEIAGRRSSMDRAQAIAISAVVYGDADRVNTDLDRLKAVTPADVQRVANRYLKTTNRTVVIAMPPSAGATEGAAQ